MPCACLKCQSETVALFQLDDRVQGSGCRVKGVAVIGLCSWIVSLGQGAVVVSALYQLLADPAQHSPPICQSVSRKRFLPLLPQHDN